MSFLSSEAVCSTMTTPFGTPFFVWTEEGFLSKVPMAQLRVEYETWEARRTMGEQRVVHEGAGG